MLRTVTFSDKRVADRVNSKFVAAWINRGPGFKDKEFWTEAGIAENNYEAYPTKNICTFFLSPEGKVFYYVAGSYSPEMFLGILDTAWTLRKMLFDDRMALKADGDREAAQFHSDKADSYEEAKTRIAQAAGDPQAWRRVLPTQKAGNYRGLPHVHGPACLWSLQQGYEYLSVLHRLWSATGVLPAFGDVQYRYLYGNEFSEETPDAPRINRPETPVASKPVDRGPKSVRVDTLGGQDIFGLGLFSSTPRRNEGK